ncbi:MAG: hypothetical protein RIG68_05990, partial [Imperialibacter sp.]|uniref:hypothetical protein n=1 Tax=Imperialibacter sp. TaxID=2038411 RepID=UPI0032EF53DA
MELNSIILFIAYSSVRYKREIFLWTFFLNSLLFGIYPALSQTVDFSLPSLVCIAGNVEVVNSSTGIDTYAWDFCDSDLSVLPSASLESTISASNFLGNIEVVQSSTGAWYGFGV